MKKSVSLLLAALLLLSSFGVNAQTVYKGNESFYKAVSAVTYNDVSYLPVDHWSNNAVYLMSALGIIKGSEGNFNNSGYLSKSEGLALSFRMAGLEPTAESYRKVLVKSKEVNPEKYNNIDSWADGYLRLAVDKDIISVSDYTKEIASDYSEATFKRWESVQKGDFIIWLVKAVGLERADKLNYVLDYRELDDYTEEERFYLETAMKNNILKGDGITLSARSPLTREQAAQILYNVTGLCLEGLGITVISGTVDRIDTKTEVEEETATVTRNIYISDYVFSASKMYKVEGEAIDSGVSLDKDYCDFITLSDKNLPSDSSALVQADNVKCYIKGEKVLCITKFGDKKTELTHNDSDYNDAQAYSGTLYFVDTDERCVVLIDDKGEYIEIPYLPDAVFCNRNTSLTAEDLNESWTDCPVYVFTIVKKTGGLSRAYRIQVVSKSKEDM